MGGRRIVATSDATVPLDDILNHGVRAQSDVSALASLNQNTLCVLVWHYHDDDIPGPDAAVDLEVTGLPTSAKTVQVAHFRIDQDHSNAFTAWKRLGAPQQPTAGQLAELERAGKLAEPIRNKLPRALGTVNLQFVVPRQGVSLLEFTW
jgi:xylan 1,4-beta-xylosidase